MIMGIRQATGLTDVPDARSMRNMLAPFMSVMLFIILCAGAMVVDNNAQSNRDRRYTSPPDTQTVAGSEGTQMRRMVDETPRAAGGDSVEPVRGADAGADGAAAAMITRTAFENCGCSWT